MSLYCMFLILKCADRLCMKHGREEIGYGDVVELAFKVGFVLLPSTYLIVYHFFVIPLRQFVSIFMNNLIENLYIQGVDKSKLKLTVLFHQISNLLVLFYLISWRLIDLFPGLFQQ